MAASLDDPCSVVTDVATEYTSNSVSSVLSVTVTVVHDISKSGCELGSPSFSTQSSVSVEVVIGITFLCMLVVIVGLSLTLIYWRKYRVRQVTQMAKASILEKETRSMYAGSSQSSRSSTTNAKPSVLML